MTLYEYTAVPAPMRSEKTKGAKTPADRYAATLTDAINLMARDGWEYLRAETLPSEERSGLTGRTTLFHNLLIFRRAYLAGHQAEAPQAAGTVAVTHSPAPAPAPAHQPEPAGQPQQVTEKVTPSPVFSEKMPLAGKAGQDDPKAAATPKAAG
ncbi:MAG: DUF4177 domain-containing protein [Paracoccus denitrificans]|uniref:DUF4177 domain-containing protein n=1 Tax=Paracoccus denitrificans TaxID=266 RepID=A0A533ICX0_PARDE|nr:MAG: DUF4177 domain-containing protein [Paracoccus denitrificans]